MCWRKRQILCSLCSHVYTSFSSVVSQERPGGGGGGVDCLPLSSRSLLWSDGKRFFFFLGKIIISHIQAQACIGFHVQSLASLVQLCKKEAADLDLCGFHLGRRMGLQLCLSSLSFSNMPGTAEPLHWLALVLGTHALCSPDPCGLSQLRIGI